MQKLVSFLLLTTLFLIGCSSGDDQKESDALFNKLMAQTEQLNQFEGTAFVGNLNGECLMVLRKREDDDDKQTNIARLRYTVGWSGEVVDETYIIRDLAVQPRDTSKMGYFPHQSQYAKYHIKGTFSALKSSIDNGAIVDGAGSGNIYFAIDSLSKKLNYIMFGEGDYQYEGQINLNPSSHIPVKKVFQDSVSPQEEAEIVASYQKVKLRSDQLIDLGGNKYKVQLSKKVVAKNSFIRKNYGDLYPKMKKIKLMSFEFENVSEDTLAILNICQRFSHEGYKRTPEQEELFWFTSNSSLFDSEYYYNVKPGDKHTFDFYLAFEASRLSTAENYFKSVCCEDGDYVDHRLTQMKIEEILEDEEFLKVFNEANKLPFIMFSGRKTEMSEDEFFSTGIYLEIVD